MSILDLLNYIGIPIMTLGAIIFILQAFGVEFPRIQGVETKMSNKWKLIIGTLVLLLSWGMSGISLYRSLQPKPGMNLKATADAWATYRYEPVLGRHFFNEAVVLDGKHFANCTFENVTFIYQGTAPVQIVDSRLIHHPDSVGKWHTDNIVVQQTTRIMKGLGMLPSGYRDEEVPFELPKD
jgi:hypothetical protein